MTREKTKNSETAKPRKKLALKKRTIRDLDAADRDKLVKGGPASKYGSSVTF